MIYLGALLSKNPMNDHHSPRTITIAFIALIGLMLLIGTLNAFSPVHAAARPSATPTGRATVTSLAGLPSPTPTPGEATPPPLRSADTGGSIGMAILLTLIILFGVMWGWRKPGMKKERPPKPVKPKKEKARKKWFTGRKPKNKIDKPS